MKKQLLRVVAAGAVIVLCGLGLRRIEWHAVVESLRHARLSLVLLAASINLVHLWCKSERWRVMLSPVAKVSPFRLYYYLIMSFAASAVLPARAGEALRVYLLRRRDGVPVSASIGIAVVEKLFEVVGILIVVAPLPLLLPLPTWASTTVAVVVAGGIGGTIAAVLIARHGSRAAAGSRWAQVVSGAQFLRRPSLVVGATAWSVLAVLIDAVEVWLVLVAVGVHVPWPTPALVLLTLNIAIAVPSTPAQLGAFEAGAVAGLNAVGVPLAPALAFALVYHIMQTVPMILLGLTGLRLVGEARAAQQLEGTT